MNNKILLVIAVLIVVAGGAYYVGTKKPQSTETGRATPTPTAEVTQTPSVSTPTAMPTVDEKETLKVIIKEQLVAKHGSTANSLVISVSKVEGNYASGAASETGGGGMWFAAKVNGQWKLVWDGNGSILCKDLVPYPNFPTDLISECYNDTIGKSVIR